MTPVGHACVGYLLATRSARICVAAMVAGAVAPDVDFLLLWSPAFNELHRTVTHSLLFVALAGAAASVAAPAGRRGAIGLGFFLGALTHLLVDSCLDGNPSNGVGVAVLWPLVPEPISPVNFLDPGPSPEGWAEPARMLPGALRMLVLEVPLAVAALAVFRRRRSLSKARGRPLAGAARN